VVEECKKLRYSDQIFFRRVKFIERVVYIIAFPFTEIMVLDPRILLKGYFQCLKDYFNHGFRELTVHFVILILISWT